MRVALPLGGGQVLIGPFGALLLAQRVVEAERRRRLDGLPPPGWDSLRAAVEQAAEEARTLVTDTAKARREAQRADSARSPPLGTRSALARLTDLLPDGKGPLQRDLRILRPSGRAVIAGFERGVTDALPSLRATLGGVTGDVAAAFADRQRPSESPGPPCTATSMRPRRSSRHERLAARRLSCLAAKLYAS